MPDDSLFSEFPPVSTEAWKEQIRNDLGDDGLARLTWEPLDEEHIDPFYRHEDLPDRTATLHSSPGWQIRQDVSASDLNAANRQLRAALDGGADGIGLAPQLDGDTLSGLPVQSSESARRLLANVPLDACAWHLDGPAAFPLLALLLNEAERRGDELQGTVTLDPLAECARSGTLDAEAAYDEAAALLQETTSTLSEVRLLAVDLAPYHGAGASPDLELALACAAMSDHLDRVTEAGCSAETVLAQLHVIVEVGRSYFLEIAKLRALRSLYQQIAGAFLNQNEIRSPKSKIQNPYVQAVTSRRDQTLFAPPTNMLRHTTEASAAIIGGADVVQIRPHDAASGATDFAHRLARNTQHVLREEAHLNRVADPSGGAYYVEVLTDRLARRAWSQFQEIESRGGLLATLRSGYVQEQIETARARTAEAIEAGHAPFVGTTLHPNTDERRRDAQPDRQHEALETTGAGYDPKEPLASRRRALAEGASLGDLLLPHREQPSTEALPTKRWTEPFEQLRLRTERHAQEHDGPPRVLLLPWGDPSMRSARADFARGFFGVAGFNVQEAGPFEAPAGIAQAAASSKAQIIVLCSSDDAYADGLSNTRQALGEREDPPLLVAAGAPQDDLDADAFIHRELPLLEALRDFQARLRIV